MGKTNIGGILNAIWTRPSLPHGMELGFGMCICEDEVSFVLAKTLSSKLV